MDKSEFKEKMNELNTKMQEMSAKIKDATDTAIIMGMEAKDVASVKLKEAQCELENAKEQFRIISERGKSKLSSELIKAQMNFNVAKEEREAKKAAKDKEELEKYIEDQMLYSEQCIALSVLAAEEAKLAFFESVTARQLYDEKYGSEEK